MANNKVILELISLLVLVIEMIATHLQLYITDFSFSWFALPIYLGIVISWSLRMKGVLRWRRIRGLAAAYVPPA
jgi:hypothetical protein